MQCRLTNDDLVDRIVKEKDKNAEEMNKMNAMVETMKAALQARGAKVTLGAGKVGIAGVIIHGL